MYILGIKTVYQPGDSSFAIQIMVWQMWYECPYTTPILCRFKIYRTLSLDLNSGGNEYSEADRQSHPWDGEEGAGTESRMILNGHEEGNLGHSHGDPMDHRASPRPHHSGCYEEAESKSEESGRADPKAVVAV